MIFLCEVKKEERNMRLFSKTKNPKKRRSENNQFIKEHNIACLETLPVIEDASQVRLRNIDEVCKKAIATYLTIQVAFDDEAGKDHQETLDFFNEYFERYDSHNYLNDNEKKIIDGTADRQTRVNVVWNYDTVWALLWYLGCVDDFKNPNMELSVEKMTDLIISCNDYNDFKSKTNPKDIEEVLDMLDLYYRYHWATVDHRINPSIEIGPLNEEVVMERRRGLEWLISDEDDWSDISLDT